MLSVAFFIVMVIMLSVVMLSVVMLSVVAPFPKDPPAFGLVSPESFTRVIFAKLLTMIFPSLFG